MNEFDFKAFISNRFDINCYWDSKNSYWFAEILCARFPTLLLAYLADEDRFIAVEEKNNVYYDYKGEHELTGKNYMYMALMIHEDPTMYKNLMDRFML